jgi:quercetin dioxygenase-like cupin family protein
MGLQARHGRVMLPRMSTRVATDALVTARPAGEGASEHRLVPAQEGSALALSSLTLGPAAGHALGDAESDTLVFVHAGSGQLTRGGSHDALAHGSAALLLAGEEAELTAGPEGLAAVHMTVGPAVDHHAAFGRREGVVRLEHVDAGSATGARSFQVLFGPHNGSIRATLFVGSIPPGRAPWHYHLYDEIVWVGNGTGRLHIGEQVEELPPGSAFRLHPRELHIVENTGEAELAVLGLFTPAGSPSAAYLPEGSAAEYRMSLD